MPTNQLKTLPMLGLLLLATAPEQASASSQAIPLWFKFLYSAYVGILVPAYWRYYGPGNFLWFSDLALFITLAAVWLESPLLASMQAVSVGLLELVWLADFLARLLGGVRLFGLSAYMFNPKIPLLIRCLSLFHLWLPPLLFWLVWRLGYDPRAWLAQTLVAWVVLPVCYLVTDPKENINWVFGPGHERQQRLSPPLYLVLVMILFSVCVYLPTHFLLLELFSRA